MEECEAREGGGVYLGEALRTELENVTISNCRAVKAHSPVGEGLARGGGLAYVCASKY